MREMREQGRREKVKGEGEKGEAFTLSPFPVSLSPF